MSSKTIKQVFRSFILVPFLATNLSVSSLNERIDGLISAEIQNKAKIEAQMLRFERANKIDAYFASADMPLEGYGMKMVIEAESNGLDWRMIPAIAVRESTGGKFACKKAKYNPFGWHSCKSGFNSYDEAIEELAKHLSGNNPRTARYYGNKDTIEKILNTYNPKEIVPTYVPEVVRIMEKIENTEIQSA